MAPVRWSVLGTGSIARTVVSANPDASTRAGASGSVRSCL
jgi:hypothetical protein